MKPIPWILAFLLVESFGLPQIPPPSQDASSGAVPAPLSPWSQWMSLKAPPISLAMPKKKKLLPGPPPPEGTPEAPWVTWTRMKVSTALAPPGPPPPPPSSSPSSNATSSPEQAVWIQWTQMKLPYTSPSLGGPESPDQSVSTPSQMTPLDAWIQSKLPMTSAPATSTDEGNAVSKRMAPDRYQIASTVAPRLAWPPQQQQQGASTGNVQGGSGVPPQPGHPALSPGITQQLLASLPPQIRAKLLAQIGSHDAPEDSNAQTPPGIQPPTLSPPRPAGPVVPITTQSAQSPITNILSSLPPQQLHQLVTVVKGTAAADPATISVLQQLPPQVLTALAQIDETQIALLSPAGNMPPHLSQLSPSVAPPLPPKAAKVPPTVALSIIPAPILSEILNVASPPEVTQLMETLSNLVILPPEEQPLITELEVESIIPPTLSVKLPSEVKPLLSAKLVPPTGAPAILTSSIPKPVLKGVVALATPDEVVQLVQNLKKVETFFSPPAATPPLAAVLPPTLLSKLPPSLAPLLAQAVSILAEKPTESSPPAPTLPPPPPSQLLPLVMPPPVAAEILAKASPVEMTEIVEKVIELAKAPPASTPVGAILPPTILPKLAPEVLPLLNTKVVIPPEVANAVLVDEIAPILAALPKPLGEVIVEEATPEEIYELVATIEKLETKAPIEVPVWVVLPATLIAKIPEQLQPLLAVEIELPPTPAPEEVPPPNPASVPAAIPAAGAELVFSVLPKPLLPVIIQAATPEELTELSARVLELEKVAPLSVPVGALLPPTLIPKIPPPISQLLRLEVSVPKESVVVPGAIPPSPVPVVPPAAIPAETLSLIVSLIPPPILDQVLAKATPPEVDELATIFTTLESIPPVEQALLPPVELKALLPSSLVAKLEPEPLLSTIVKLPLTPSPLPILPGAPPLAAPPTEMLSTPPFIPQPVISQILQVATPEEIVELQEILSKLESVPPEEKPLLELLEVESILSPSLLAKLSPELEPLLAEKLAVPVPAAPIPNLKPSPLPPVPQLEATEAPWLSYIKSVYGIPEEAPLPETAATLPLAPPPLPESSPEPELPISPAEEKLLTKWAKVILEKTGKPVTAPPLPGEIPPLQAAWTEWIQLQVNKTTLPAPVVEATTEYPWTKSLKLKPSPIPPATPTPLLAPSLDVTTDSPEKQVLEWLESLEKPTPPAPEISPETEEKVTELLKQLGIEKVDLPPAQLKELLEEVEKVKAMDKATPPPAIPVESLPPPAYPMIPPMMPYLPWAPKPFWSPYMPYMYPPVPMIAPPQPPVTAPEGVAPPPIPETVATEPSPPPAENSSEVEVDEATTTVRTITTNELASFTPTKFAALLKDILKDCNRTNILVTRSSSSSKIPPVANYYKQKYKWKGGASPMGRRALYPIPSEGAATKTLPTEEQEQSSSLLPLPSFSMPKVETSGTVLDPAYWTAQKSLFLSKLFSTLAKVATNESNAQTQATTVSPKEQLAKQVNTVLLRSIHHKQKEKVEQEADDEEDEEETEVETSKEAGQDVNENELVTNDNSEPNLPKEPENPLHKLFKFGVQKTVLSDLSTPPSPIYVYVTPPPPPTPEPASEPESTTTPSLAKQKEMIDRLKQVYSTTKEKERMKKKKAKGKKRKHHSNKKKKHSFRPTTTTTTLRPTTENPVDFELLAKALLLDKSKK